MFNKNVDKENSVLPSKKKPYACRIKLDPRIKLFSTKQYAFLPFRLPERLIWYPLAHTTGTIRSHMFIDFAFTKS